MLLLNTKFAFNSFFFCFISMFILKLLCFTQHALYPVVELHAVVLISFGSLTHQCHCWRVLYTFTFLHVLSHACCDIFVHCSALRSYFTYTV